MRCASVLAAALLVLAAGCERKHPAVYNDELVNTNRRLAKAALDFQRAISPLRTGGAVSTAAVQKAYDDLVKVLDEVQAEAKGQKPPATQSGRSLYNAYQRYLEGQRKIVEAHFAEIVRIAGESGTGAARWAKIDAVLKKIEQAEIGDSETFKKAHQAYAQTYNYTLTPPQIPGQ